MAFQDKTDYCGLSLLSGFVVRDSSLNGSIQKYQPVGTDGAFIATEVYGADTDPSNNYALSANATVAAGALKLGKIITENNQKFALSSVSISTTAGSEPTISATANQVESTANDNSSRHFSVPAFALTTNHSAQDIFSAFTAFTGGNVLTACSATISCTVNKVKVGGSTVCSDVSQAVITISGSVLQTGSTAPTLTASTGWTITQPIAGTESNPEASYKTYSFELQKTLTVDAATNRQSAG